MILSLQLFAKSMHPVASACIGDIIVQIESWMSLLGGATRGTILKRITSSSKKDYCYGFNQEDNLILARTESIIEAIFCEDGCETGISFSRFDNSINFLSESVYDGGKLQTYSTFCYIQGSNKVTNCERHCYHYTNKDLIVDWYSYVKCAPNNSICNKQLNYSYYRYIFPLINGKISKGTEYSVYEYCPESRTLKEQTVIGDKVFLVPNGRTYKVNMDRDI